MSGKLFIFVFNMYRYFDSLGDGSVCFYKPRWL